MDLQSDSLTDSKSGSKAPVHRGARACTVCRAAKMKCVGAEDGQKQCQRCKRANVECVFEKHRRGRKPGSKLSEASKMLRRLEKGLNNAKLKSAADNPAVSPYQSPDSRPQGPQDSHYNGARQDASGPYTPTTSHFPSNELPPLNLGTYQAADAYPPSSNGSRSMDVDEDEEDADRTAEVFPAKMIKRENQRNSFFRTILNPEEVPATNGPINRNGSQSSPQSRIAHIPNDLNDPITAGLIDEETAAVLFDAIFLRLNPFVNLFDPALHTVAYVRSKCPFLFTTLIMAGCKFFRPELFKQCQKLANDLAVRAFADAWKRVEVIQAFACLTYWKDPDDNRTWTYIGYACRMAVELNLNRYVPVPPPHETELQRLERRNRERTYLVLFVHDRSLSTQTGRHWMLPEDDLIEKSETWHLGGGGPTRPEDVIIAAFVALRRIAAQTTDIFNTSPSRGTFNDINYEVVLRNCNLKLTQWGDMWQKEMDKAGGQKFHSSFLSFFRVYVRLFLNSFGLQASMQNESRTSPSLQALTACRTSALDSLRIISNDFASFSMLRYGQDSITIMSAYSAVFLLRLLRSPNTFAQLEEGTAQEIHELISKTADAYLDASILSPTSTSAAYHARFLRSLIANDLSKARRSEKIRHDAPLPIDPRLQGPPNQTNVQKSTTQTQMYPHQVVQAHDSFQFPASPHLPAHPTQQGSDYVSDTPMGHVAVLNNAGVPYHQAFVPTAPHHASELDAHYWKNMFLELGFGEGVEGNGAMMPGSGDERTMQQHQQHYQLTGQHAHQQQSQPQQQHQHQQQHIQHPNQVSYHHMHYGHRAA